MRRLRRDPRPRGQVLVLLTVTMLVIVVAALTTVGLSIRVKEKMELQTLADASAYSNSVATARVLNTISVMNRAEVSLMVAMASTQSLISYAGAYRGALNSLENVTGAALEPEAPVDPLDLPDPSTRPCAQPADGCGWARCALHAEVSAAVAAAKADFTEEEWDARDETAGGQARTQQGVATGIRNQQEQIFEQLWNEFLRNQRLAGEIVAGARPGDPVNGEVTAPPVNAVNQREVMYKNDCPEDSTCSSTNAFALNPRGVSRELGVQAAMGSRGASFVTTRNGGGPLAEGLNAHLPVAVASYGGSGEGKWSQNANPAAEPGPAPYASTAWDSGNITVTRTFGACSASVSAPVDARVVSDDETESSDDVHSWTSGADDPGEANPDGGGPSHRHTMGSCNNCPGVWTMFIDLNPEHVADWNDHLHGQPKNVAMIQRDYGLRPEPGEAGADPWDLQVPDFFSGFELDTRPVATPLQTAVAHGITYYHRQGRWVEPPNFFNPFWRATLINADIDRQFASQNDVRATLNEGGAAARSEQVFNQLRSAGFRGWH